MNINQDEYSINSISKIRERVFKELSTVGYSSITNITTDNVTKIINSLGKPFKQESGKKHFVEYQKGYDDFRYSKSLNDIGPHSEYPYYEIPPKFQMLYCINPSNCLGGQTYTCDTKNLIKLLSKEEIDLLTTIKISFSANKDLNNIQSQNNAFPILSKHSKNTYVFRFSHNLLYYGDVNANIHSEKKGDFLAKIEHPHFEKIVGKIIAYFNSNKQTWNIPKNGLLVWNNHHVVHWRSGYKDKNRKLIRYLIE